MNEYSGKITNSNYCYSNLSNYGAFGKCRPIVAPVPSTMLPRIFYNLKPHNQKVNYEKKKIGKNLKHCSC